MRWHNTVQTEKSTLDRPHAMFKNTSLSCAVPPFCSESIFVQCAIGIQIAGGVDNSEDYNYAKYPRGQ